MATTVIEAFSEFLRDTVNLDAEQTKTAKSSRDWLVDQVHAFPDKVHGFPKLYTEVDMPFGSFARHTKIRPLDDIDQIIGISAEGATYIDYGRRVELTLPSDSSSNLSRYFHDGTRLVNSRKIINVFVGAAGDIPQYAKADISRNGEAVTLGLSSYPWSFDLVPAFFTKPELDGRTFYIIPDGAGHWKKTDPRLDRDRVNRINAQHDGNMLNILRTMRFWNSRKTAPAAPSYMFENLILSHFEPTSKASGFVDIELPNCFRHVSQAIFYAVQDPKRVEGDLNSLDFDTRLKISGRAADDAKLADKAREFERGKDEKSSINTWREIFGPDFPTFG